MMIREENGALFVRVTINYKGQWIDLYNVMLDISSPGTIFNVDCLEQFGVRPECTDFVHRVEVFNRKQYVFSKQMTQIIMAKKICVNQFTVECGQLDSDFGIDGIIGFDFLRTAGVVLDLEKLTLVPISA